MGDVVELVTLGFVVVWVLVELAIPFVPEDEGTRRQREQYEHWQNRYGVGR